MSAIELWFLITNRAGLGQVSFVRGPAPMHNHKVKIRDLKRAVTVYLVCMFSQGPRQISLFNATFVFVVTEVKRVISLANVKMETMFTSKFIGPYTKKRSSHERELIRKMQTNFTFFMFLFVLFIFENLL